jgi:hypothetical protein
MRVRYLKVGRWYKSIYFGRSDGKTRGDGKWKMENGKWKMLSRKEYQADIYLSVYDRERERERAIKSWTYLI